MQKETTSKKTMSAEIQKNLEPENVNNLNMDNIENYDDGMFDFDILDMAKYCLRHWKILLIALIIGAGLGYGYHTFFIHDLYRADTSVFISDSSKAVDIYSFSLTSALSQDYQKVLMSRETMKEVVKDLGLDMNYQQLRGMVGVSKEEDTHILTITATASDRDLAREIANSLSRVGIARMQKVIAKCEISVIDTATNDAITVVTPNRNKYIGIGALIGLGIPLAILIIVYLMDNSFKSEDDVMERLKKPVLAAVPYYGKKNLVTTKLNYYEKEAFNTLYGNISLSGDENRVIALTSSNANEGKSTISFKLAEIITNYGKKVCYVDSDMRNSSFCGLYGIDKSINPGLSGFLSGHAKVEDVLVRDDNNQNLFIIPAGKNPPNPSALVSADRYDALIKALRKSFDYVIIDTPPVNAVIDGVFIANKCDGTILVIESITTNSKMAIRAMNDLNMTNVNVLGVVVNKVGRNSKRGYGYGTYGYGKHKGYGKRGKSGYGYGYGYGYGNGYGYGYGYVEPSKDNEKK